MPKTQAITNTKYSLPLLGCGNVALPGMPIWRMYLDSRWEAKIINVGESTIDIQYTNKGNHANQYGISRLRNPQEWKMIAEIDTVPISEV